MTIKLKIVQGKPRGFFLHFPDGEFVFGRGPECHVRPNSELVSRQHCLLKVTAGHIHIRDLGSTNGTLVNGKRLLDELPLQEGDIVQLGGLVLQVVTGDELPGEAGPLDTALVGRDDTLARPPEVEDTALGDAPIMPGG
jgi:pSer/pThr/pTyr-binding forkhead associated (FHA) protein